MHIRHADYAHGPNAHCPRSALWVLLDLGPLAGIGSAALGDAFRRELAQLFPDLAAATGADGSSFTAALNAGDGLSLADIFPALLMQLQRMAGFEVTWGQTLVRDEPGQYLVLVECPAREAGTLFARFGLVVLNNLLPPALRTAELSVPGIDLQQELRHFLAAARGWSLDGFGNAVLREAERRGIPWTRLGLGSRVTHLGHGVHGRRIHGASSDLDGAAAVRAVRDRAVCRELLLAAGLPVPRGFRVSSAQELLAAAGEIGYPVVLQADSDHGADDAGVSVETEPELLPAAQTVHSPGGALLVSEATRGRRYRLLTIGGRLVTASTAAEPPGDCSGEVNAHVRALAETAAAQFRLGACEILFDAPELAADGPGTPGLITGVRYPADLAFHQRAVPGRDLAGPFLDTLFPQGDGCIPVATVTGSNGKTTTVQMLAHILGAAGRVCGSATTQGIFIGGRRIHRGDASGSLLNELLLNPRVEVAVVENALAALRHKGLRFEHCEVGAVLNVTREHVRPDGVRSIEELARIKALVAEHTRGTLVLNADDPRCLAMAPRSRARRLCLVSCRPGDPNVTAHLAGGGAAAFVTTTGQGRVVSLHQGTRTLLEIAADAIPATYGDSAGCNVTNAAFAAAMAWGMGVEPARIAAALRTFEATFETNPGRLNLFDELPFRVIVDYAHNPEKYAALVEFVGGIATPGRRLLLLQASGHAREGHYRDIARACAPAFDHFLLARPALQQNIGERGVQDQLQDALLAAGIGEQAITRCGSQEEAIDAALDLAQPGDLLVLSVDDAVACRERMRAWAHMAGHTPRG